MKSAIAEGIWLLCLLLSFGNTPAVTQAITTDPDRVPLEVGDVRRLAAVARAMPVVASIE